MDFRFEMTMQLRRPLCWLRNSAKTTWSTAVQRQQRPADELLAIVRREAEEVEDKLRHMLCLGSTGNRIFDPASGIVWRLPAENSGIVPERFFALRKDRREEGGICGHRRTSNFHLARRSSWSSPELYPPAKRL